MTIPDFRPEQSAVQAHRALKQSITISDQAQHCAVLWFADIFNRKLYRQLGFSSMNQYAAERLGFSRARIGNFMRLAKKLGSLPALKNELAAGTLGYTKAREIVRVADATNEKEWLATARHQSRRQLEETVRRAKTTAKRQRSANPDQTELLPQTAANTPPAAAPVRVSFALSPSQYARYEALLAGIDDPGDQAELLLTMMETFTAARSKKTPRGVPAPPYQIHVHECPTCAVATVQTPRGEQILSRAEQEAAHCDAQTHIPGQRNQTTIPPRTRREILARDRHKCRRKGCRHTRHLHLHHLVPRSQGGTNDPENLVTLCPACHDLWHRRGGDLRRLLTDIPDHLTKE